MKKVYIDIHGVLLTRQLTVPEHGHRFVEFLTNSFDCFWLTTHCRGGVNQAFDYLFKYYDQNTINIIQSIKPSDWTDLKTEGIDFNSEFFWIVDDLLEAEKKVLIKQNKLESLVLVDLNRTNELINVENKLINTNANNS